MKNIFLIAILFLFCSCTNIQESMSPGQASKIDHEGIRQTFGSHQKELQTCYETTLKNTKDLEGKMTFDFTIGKAGKVLKAQVDSNKSTLSSNELGTCIQNLILSWTFPLPPDNQEVQVYYPMIFSGAKKK